METTIYAVINQKGGVGKSTTAEALSAGLFLKGFKTLAIDLDAQGNMSYTAKASTEGSTALGVLMGEVRPEVAIQHTDNSGDIIAARCLHQGNRQGIPPERSVGKPAGNV